MDLSERMSAVGPPRAQQDGLLDGQLVERQLYCRPALDVRPPVLLRLVDSVTRGPFCEVVLEGLNVGVKG